MKEDCKDKKLSLYHPRLLDPAGSFALAKGSKRFARRGITNYFIFF